MAHRIGSAVLVLGGVILGGGCGLLIGFEDHTVNDSGAGGGAASGSGVSESAGIGGASSHTSTQASSTTAGVGGSGGGGTPKCVRCGNYVTDGGTLCNDNGPDPKVVDGSSEDLYAKFFDCVCTVAVCGDANKMPNCTATACNPSPKDPDTDCDTCTTNAKITANLNGGCATEYEACTGDIE